MRMPGSLVRRVRRLPPTVADGLLAALVTVLGLSQLFVESDSLTRLDVQFRSPNAAAVLLTLAQTVPLVWRRRYPRAVLAVTITAAAVHLLLGFQPTFAEAGMLIALYTVAAHCAGRRAVVAGLAAAVALVVYGVIAELRYPSSFQDSLQGWTFAVVQFGAAWVLGRAQNRRLAYTAKLEALNAQLATEQELRSRWAVAAERGRIARELHDVVAHSVSVMVVQAGAARRTLAASPDQATTALGQIESTGRQALVELRRLLGLLRDGEQGDGAALAPQPGLDHLERLAASAREAGLPVEVTVEGDPRPLPAGVDLSAYRIVQEALTNSLKHAGPARASVRVRYGRDALEVQVTDDGEGMGSAFGRLAFTSDRPAGRSGNGLIGMRERVAMFGGTLETGARPGGGYRVAARLPLDNGSP